MEDTFSFLFLSILNVAHSQVYDQPCTTIFPCFNGGVCTGIGTSGALWYQCSCPTGYQGSNCQLLTSTATGCQSNPCFNGGACVAFLSGAFVCKCPTGFSGVNCENLYASEACAVNQCGNNLACYNRNEPNQPNYVCECTQPNTGGYNCQTTTANNDIFTCYGSKCFYGTFSSPNYPNMYVARYSALYLLYAPNVDRIDMFFDNIFNVERPKDELYIGAGLTSLDIGSLTGQHISSLNMFYFDGSQRPGKISIVSDSAWMYFFTDKNVEQSGFRIRWEMYINPCNNLLCQNGGTCQLDATRKIGTCLCLSCYVGSVCETALNACSNNFCQNGAACVQAGSSCTEYTCVCFGNYNGTFCETSLSRLMASSVSPFPVDSTVTDSDTDNCTFTVQVIEDNEASNVVCPDDKTRFTNSTQVTVTWDDPSVSDNVDTGLSATCTPPSGSLFNAGSTVVTCSAMDTAGNTGFCQFTVIIVNEDSEDSEGTSSYTVPGYLIAVIIVLAVIILVICPVLVIFCRFYYSQKNKRKDDTTEMNMPTYYDIAMEPAAREYEISLPTAGSDNVPPPPPPARVNSGYQDLHTYSSMEPAYTDLKQ